MEIKEKISHKIGDRGVGEGPSERVGKSPNEREKERDMKNWPMMEVGEIGGICRKVWRIPLSYILQEEKNLSGR